MYILNGLFDSDIDRISSGTAALLSNTEGFSLFSFIVFILFFLHKCFHKDTFYK